MSISVDGILVQRRPGIRRFRLDDDLSVSSHRTVAHTWSQGGMHVRAISPPGQCLLQPHLAAARVRRAGAQVSFLTAVLMGVALTFHSLLEGAALGAQPDVVKSLHIFIAIQVRSPPPPARPPARPPAGGAAACYARPPPMPRCPLGLCSTKASFLHHRGACMSLLQPSYHVPPADLSAFGTCTCLPLMHGTPAASPDPGAQCTFPEQLPDEQTRPMRITESNGRRISALLRSTTGVPLLPIHLHLYSTSEFPFIYITSHQSPETECTKCKCVHEALHAIV